MIPPKPSARPRKTSLFGYLRLFRRDILSAQPEHLFRAWMAEFRTPFFRSVLINDPKLIRTVLQERSDEFPKSGRVNEGLRPLLGDSVFVSNGEAWARQRRIIDPAFEGGRITDSLPAIFAAAQMAVGRITPGIFDVEEAMSHATADVVFRALFSVPIDQEVAAQTFAAFRRYQRAQPIVNVAALLPLPRWLPRGVPASARRAGAEIRAMIEALVDERARAIASGTAPDDLATRIMTTPDPDTGERFSEAEMVDQVAIFFLAGHETSAAALSWALWLIAQSPELQDELAEEARGFHERFSSGVDGTAFNPRRDLPRTLDVVRETLRLYPPVPMLVRQTSAGEAFRQRDLGAGTQVVISPWHLHRHERLWDDPDRFDPSRWQREGGAPTEAYLPFSKGPRTCPGAAFALTEASVIIAHFLVSFRLSPVEDERPEPVAHLTLRSRKGIKLRALTRV